MPNDRPFYFRDKGPYFALYNGEKIIPPGETGNHRSYQKAASTAGWHKATFDGDGEYSVHQPEVELEMNLMLLSPPGQYSAPIPPALNLGVVTANLVASRVSGPAPLAVQFDATGTTHSDGSISTWRELGYYFLYDDAGAGNWVTGKSKEFDAGGPLAGHVFETPGTYTVKLRARDSSGGPDNGSWDDTSVVITVDDPDVTYAGTLTVCISTDTDTTGSPAGASLLTNQTVWPTFEDDKRYMLRAGQDFSSFGMMAPFNIDSVQLTKFGTGADPIVLGINLSVFSGSWNDGLDYLTNCIAYDIECTDSGRIGNNAENCYFFRCTLDDAAADQGFNGPVTQPSASVSWLNKELTNWPKYCGIVECTAAVTLSATQHNVLSGVWESSFIAGNSLGPAPQHIIRIWAAHRLLIQHNSLLDAGDTKHNIKLHASGEDAWSSAQIPSGTYLEPRSSYCITRGNHCGAPGDGNEGDGAMYISPQNALQSELVEYTIDEENEYNADFGVNLRYFGREQTARGNIDNTGTIYIQAPNNTMEDYVPPPIVPDGPYYGANEGTDASGLLPAIATEAPA